MIGRPGTTRVSPHAEKRRRAAYAAGAFLVAAAAALGSAARAQSDAPAAATPAAEQSVYGGVVSRTLPNGLRLLVLPKRSVAISAVDIWVRAGSRCQAPGQEGVAHYLEHILFTGTPTHPHETDIDGAIEELGGSLDAATSYDWAHFFTVVPSQSFESALGVMADAIRHADIAPASVESERPVIESEISRAEDDPAGVVDQASRAALFAPTSAYGQPITGTAAQAALVTRDQVASFYHAWYVPSNVTLVVCGDVDPVRALAAAEAAFGDWHGPDAPPLPALPPVPALREPVTQVLTRSVDQATLAMSWPAPSVLEHPDVWTMDVLLTYLGQGGRNVLDDDLRARRHLVTAIGADFLTQRDPGLLTVTATLPAANLPAARSAILRHVRALLAQPLSASELADAKQQLVASYLFDAETVSGRADSLGFYSSIDSYRYDVRYLDRVNSVTAAQLQQVAERYLDPARYVETDLVPPATPEDAARLRAAPAAAPGTHPL